MEIDKAKAVIEAILFAAGRVVTTKELMIALEINEEDIIAILQSLIEERKEQNSGMEILRVNDGYQMASKPEYHEAIYSILDKRNKPNLSGAALETLAIVAYNPKVTRAEIESIRGVNSDATIYKLLEYELIQEAGRLDAPGRPTTYQTSEAFLKMFGYTSLEDLPDLPRYKVDENEQIVIDELVPEEQNQEAEEITEAPIPEREDEKMDVEET